MATIAVQVRFFASLREALGHESLQCQVPNGCSLAQLLRELDRQLGEASTALRAENVRVAVNQSLVSTELALNAGDEVAFLPPVTGG